MNENGIFLVEKVDPWFLLPAPEPERQRSAFQSHEPKPAPACPGVPPWKLSSTNINFTPKNSQTEKKKQHTHLFVQTFLEGASWGMVLRNDPSSPILDAVAANSSIFTLFAIDIGLSKSRRFQELHQFDGLNRLNRPSACCRGSSQKNWFDPFDRLPKLQTRPEIIQIEICHQIQRLIHKWPT